MVLIGLLSINQTNAQVAEGQWVSDFYSEARSRAKVYTFEKSVDKGLMDS